MTAFVILLILFILYALFSCIVMSDYHSKLKDYRKDLIKLYKAETRNTEADFDLDLFICKVNNVQETLDSLRTEMQLLQKRIKS